jgi:uncharacterized RDD family membrane protein YckC
MSSDLRKYASQTTFRLVVGALLLLFLVGVGLIWAIYGTGAALMGLLCLLGAMIPIGLVWFILVGLDKLVKKLDRD